MIVEKFVIKKYRGDNQWTYYWQSATYDVKKDNVLGMSNFYGNLIDCTRFNTYGEAKEIVDSQKTGIYQIEKIFENETIQSETAVESNAA